MAKEVMDARSRVASSCALIKTKGYSSASLPAPQLPEQGRPGGNPLRKIAARRAEDGSQ